MLVIRNMTPPTAMKERAGKSMLDSADAKRRTEGEVSSHCCNICLSETKLCFSPGPPKAIISVAVVYKVLMREQKPILLVHT